MKNSLKLLYLTGIVFAFLSLASCSDDKNTEAMITKMTFDNPIVVLQPEIEGPNITFYVSSDATDEELATLVPTIEYSHRATVSPASGSVVDFSNGPVLFTVTSEEGKSKTIYNVSFKRYGKYDFEEWVSENDQVSGDQAYYAPVGSWSTSNSGALLLIGMGYLNKYLVTQTNDAYAGNSAARMETLDSKGLSFLGFKIPKITTGTLFLGKFRTNDLDTKNTLRNTQFGITYTKKPLTVKGYYKYIPGEIFYRCSDQSSINIAVEEAGTVDQCAINAILYEIESEEDEYLTGEDAYTSDKLVAVGILEDGTAKDVYTPFSFDMTYLKNYDPAKKYRFAIICSSSKEGDKFSGAPGSALYVDDIEVISE